MPFTYLRAYATELCTTRPAGGPRREPDGDGPSDGRSPGSGAPPPAGGRAPRRRRRRDRPRRPAAPTRAPSLTHLFFSEDLMELARARAICSLCAVRDAVPQPGARRARSRTGVWGGEMLIDGASSPRSGAGAARRRSPGRASSSTRSRRPHRRLTGRSSYGGAAVTGPLDGHPRARSLPRPRRAALHADAVGPRGRRDQGRAAGRRPDPLRQPPRQRAVDVLRAAERRQAQHQHRPRHAARRGAGCRARRRERRRSSRTTAPA